MREVHELPVETLARDLLHLEVRMGERKPEQFAAGVPGRADDGNGKPIGHDLG